MPGKDLVCHYQERGFANDTFPDNLLQCAMRPDLHRDEYQTLIDGVSDDAR
jgi:hypothetical protein